VEATPARSHHELREPVDAEALVVVGVTGEDQLGAVVTQGIDQRLGLEMGLVRAAEAGAEAGVVPEGENAAPGG
jgi:hypothetical protein